jgi:xylulose-5-phosphate/fructose-6-phosphate phosphoketolase
LEIPNFREFEVEINKRGDTDVESTRVLGKFLHGVMQANLNQRNFRVVGPDETASNRLQDVITGTGKTWLSETLPVDVDLSPTGRVMEVLSEHLCQGWLEGYLLTGRHGFFSCYEAFIHIVDSMVNQHAKWLKTIRSIPWRKPIASLNYLLTSLVWRQDHNGFSHQDPGFIDHLLNKKADVVRVYLPPDANTLLSVGDHCLRSRNYINLIVAGKQPAPQWLSMTEAIEHCTIGMGKWEWASDEGEPDVVLACCGDVPTMETLAAATILRERIPDIKIRVVNVVDLMALQPQSEHPHGLTDEDFDAIFTKDKPVIFAFHGYPYVIHRLTYRRTNHDNIHVRGYKEEGTTTTPFDMCVLNNIDRFQLTMDAVIRTPCFASHAEDARQWYSEQIQRHKLYVAEHGDDMPEVKNWRWPGER